ncbi:hypothetical protein [Thiothrix fructosivorans]|uniref:Uncharacterized protein n=1 Tax=Thiothrix fructosivorans TaxID=111770 RepID=A0A8B0SQZ6_9GAMM|nr:hypothetical protein [Thiothrix fructosivorans]MBO0612400.1 hypothetical protein [Thiothrix fructosivorans]QTX12117.1 hypothetical protein J1836_007270 [Thiothrix fructosivorans]
MKIKHIFSISVSALLLSSLTPNAFADVYINGHYISPKNIEILEKFSGEKIPSGRYWLDLATGKSGYGDAPPVSHTSSPYYEDRVAASIAGMGYSIPTPSTAFTPGSSFTYPY